MLGGGGLRLRLELELELEKVVCYGGREMI